MTEADKYNEYGGISKEERRKRHAVCKKGNTGTLENYFVSGRGFPFTTSNNGETLLFRSPGKPSADFYPSTGRWTSRGKTFYGGAHGFIKWYRKQVA